MKSRYVHPRTIRRLAEKSLRREKQSRKDREAATREQEDAAGSRASLDVEGGGK